MTLPRRLRPVGEAAPFLGIRALLGLEAESIALSDGHIPHLQFAGWRTLAYASGTEALAAAIKTAAGEKRTSRPRVIVPAYACPDIVSAAVFAGAEPVLADTLPDSPWLDPAAVSSLITADTVAVVYLRFLGLAANDLALRSALGDSRVLLIEDCAHSFPLDSRVDSSADLLVFSFGRGKPVPLRSGGALMLRNESLASGLMPTVTAPGSDTTLARMVHWARCLAYNAAIHPNVYWLLTQFAGGRVDAITWRQLRSVKGIRPSLAALLPEAIEHQRRQTMRQQERLASLLQGIAGPWIDLARSVAARAESGDTSSVRGSPRLWRYPLLLPNRADRDRIFRALWDQGLGASRLYGATLSELPRIRPFVNSNKETNARDLAARLLALPLHSGVHLADLERIVSTLGQINSNVDLLAAHPLRS